MKLPKDLLTQNYTKPDVYLCEVDKTRICKLDTIEASAVLKFNAYSEFECTISRVYTDIISGEQRVNPFYDKIEALRLLYIDGFGYFQIQDPEIVNDGIKETKHITAYSLEYSLSQRYLEEFYINTGEERSLEVVYAEDKNGDNIINHYDIESIVFYNPVAFTEYDKKHSLLHLVLENTYGWHIGHVDASLQKASRRFEITRSTIYDFIMQDICEKFNCFVVFDTDATDNQGNKINTISFYAEAPITKFKGDGKKTEFKISPAYDYIDTVTINSYKTSKYTYVKKDENAGILTFKEAPSDGANIEVKDGSQTKYSTDIYVTFENLAQEVNISYSADNIKTVLTVKGADNIDIREVNMCLPYITDLSYYYSVDWMGQDLYDAYKAYLEKSTKSQDQYIAYTEQMLDLDVRIDYEENRMSLQYSIASHVNSFTVGTYYVRKGTDPDYYYQEVKLPEEYNAKVEHYYSLAGNDLNEDKVLDLYTALQTYYLSEGEKIVTEIDELAENFAFMSDYGYTIAQLSEDLKKADTIEQKDYAVERFLKLMWGQIGKMPLESLYKTSYVTTKERHEDNGWNDPNHKEYLRYYTVTVMLDSIDDAIRERDKNIKDYQDQKNEVQKNKNELTSSLNLINNFTPKQLVRLNAFWREDEYTDDNFVITDPESPDALQIKQELLECGRIELSKLSEPKLTFSMTMANIYALHEFEPIVNQFQLGNLINIEIRPRTSTEDAYVKRARLLEVNINFDDFSDFSCEFGELTNLSTPLSVHADLLSTALQAGSSVASSSSYWDKGANLATSTDVKIQQGLLSANTLYNADQSLVIDNNGILLRKVKSDGSFSPYQAWLTSNTLLFSSDGFKEGSTPRAGFGEFTIDGQTFYGVLAEAMLAGYIEGSRIVGGTINIGDGKFVVNQDGSVVMKASSIDGYVQEGNVISAINQSAESVSINANKISLSGKKINLTSDNVTIDSTNFSVTKDGKITAKSGEIGGWTIGASSISGTSGNYQALISKDAIGQSGNVVFGVYDGSSWSCYMDGVGKLYASNADIQGKITATSGTIGGCTISNGVLNVDAANITSGTIDNARISNLSADKITAGTLNVERIPNLNANKITAGTISVDRIPSLSADKITSGTISTDRLNSSVITTDNFSSKTLSTGNLTVASGCRLGVASEYNAKLYSSGGYTWMEAFIPNSSYISSMMNIVRAGVNVASSREIKSEIHDFDERYNAFFDKLNPQLFKYNFELDMGYSMGFIWEEAKDAMDDCGLSLNDLGSIHESAGTIGGKSLRKDDFVALNTWQIQKLKDRVAELEKKIEELKG